MLDYRESGKYLHDVLGFNREIDQYYDGLDAMCYGDILNTYMNMQQKYDVVDAMAFTLRLLLVLFLFLFGLFRKLVSSKIGSEIEGTH